MSGEDIVLWPDGTWCYFEDLEEMSFMSDDYKIIPYLSEEWSKVIKKEELI